MQSHWVNWELDEVVKRNKRLVPVMVGETPRDALPRQLGEIRYPARGGVFDAAQHLDTLVQVLETDRAWLKEASRLQDRAVEWLAKGRGSALLLPGGALAAAERWKDARPAKAPLPAQEVLDLLHASRRAVTRRQRWWTGGSITFAVFALGLAWFAESQRSAAVNQKRVTQELREQTQKTESGLLANAANASFGGSREWTGITDASLLALEALPDAASNVIRPHVPEAEWQLDRANRRLQERVRINWDKAVGAASFSSDGARIVTTFEAGGLVVWDAITGRELLRLNSYSIVYAAAFSPDGSRILTASADNTARVWDAAAGRGLEP